MTVAGLAPGRVAESGTAQIAVRGAVKGYRTLHGGTQEALASVYLEIPRGQFVSSG